MYNGKETLSFGTEIEKLEFGCYRPAPLSNVHMSTCGTLYNF
jgi:hypothetical protein